MNEANFFQPTIEKPKKRPTPEEEKTIREYYAGGMHAHSRKSSRESLGGAKEGAKHSYERLLFLAQKMGMDFEVFTEHGSNPGSPEKLEEDHPICQAILNEVAEVKQANEYVRSRPEAFSGKPEEKADSQRKVPKAFSGVEASVFFDENGEAILDIPDSVLAKPDMVIASRHAIDDQRDPQKIKDSLMTIINHPEVDIVGHPYKNIEFYENDWNYFKKYYREKDPETSEKLERYEKKEDWNNIKKIIGKTKPDSDETKNLAEKFSALHKEYWNSWDEILDAMEKSGKAFEINLNVFRSDKEFYQKILKEAGKRKNLRFSISFDFHSLMQIASIKDVGGAEKPSKENKSLNAREKAINTITKLIELLKQNNIGPERIVNSSQERLEEFLNRDK